MLQHLIVAASYVAALLQQVAALFQQVMLQHGYNNYSNGMASYVAALLQHLLELTVTTLTVNVAGFFPL